MEKRIDLARRANGLSPVNKCTPELLMGMTVKTYIETLNSFGQPMKQQTDLIRKTVEKEGMNVNMTLATLIYKCEKMSPDMGDNIIYNVLVVPFRMLSHAVTIRISGGE